MSDATAPTPDRPRAVARIAHEPLVWFLAVGALLFALDRPGQEVDADDARVVVTAGRIEQLASVFAKTWMRPPTADEMRGIVRSHVLEELKVRRALALGLDRDDTVIRRRLAQKWDFLTEPDADLLTPSDDRLEAFLEANAERFRVEPKYALRQVFVSTDRQGERADAVADERLAALEAGEAVDSDPTLLPEALTGATARFLDGVFGTGFASRVEALPPGEWRRVDSTFGIHLVRVDARDPGRVPPLAEVRDAVAREWAAAEREARETRREEELLASVEIVVEWPVALGNDDGNGDAPTASSEEAVE